MGDKDLRKRMDVEIDLIAFISLLSVCICFLLLTSIWIHISSMNFKQSLGGGEAVAEQTSSPQLWVDFKEAGHLSLNVKNGGKKLPGKLRKYKLAGGEDGAPSLAGLKEYLKSVKLAVPQLETAFLQPGPHVKFEDIVNVMDTMRIEGVSDLGITPL